MDKTEMLLQYTKDNLQQLLYLAKHNIPIVMCCFCQHQNTPGCPMDKSVAEGGELSDYDFWSYGEVDLYRIY